MARAFEACRSPPSLPEAGNRSLRRTSFSQRGTEEDVWTYHSWTASQRGKDPANLPAVGTGHTANSFPTQVGLGEEGNIDRHIQ